jgi:hypothetical protein
MPAAMRRTARTPCRLDLPPRTRDASPQREREGERRPVLSLSGVLLALIIALPLVASPAYAAPSGAFATHILVDAEGVAGWRVAFGRDDRAPGFQAIAGGGQVAIGSEVGAGFGLLGGARALVGQAGNQRYLEVSGALILQLRIGERVRMRLGGEGGEVWFDEGRGGRAVLLGGWLGATIDIVTFRQSAIVLAPRVDVSGFLAELPTLPDLSLAFSVGVGVRY